MKVSLLDSMGLINSHKSDLFILSCMFLINASQFQFEPADALA